MSATTIPLLMILMQQTANVIHANLQITMMPSMKQLAPTTTSMILSQTGLLYQAFVEVVMKQIVPRTMTMLKISLDALTCISKAPTEC
jgi:hypothetical protein